MKNFLLTLLLAIGVSGSLMAQFTPQGFNYQCVVRNTDGTPVVNQTVKLIFLIKSGAPNGPVAYSEQHTTSTNQYGLVNLVIGQGTPTPGQDFTTVNWGGGAKFLTVSVESSSPGVYNELGSSQLMSVPYALYSQTSGSGGSGPGADNWGTQSVQTTPALSGNGTGSSPLGLAQQNAQSGQVLKWDGSKWAPSDDVTASGSNGGTVTQVNTGAGLTGGPITNSGTISLANSGVTPGIYGSATQIPVISVDAQGRVTSVAPIVVQPGAVGLNGGTGIGIQNNSFNNFTVTNTGDTNAADDVNLTTSFGGDVTGNYNDLQIKPNAVGSPEIGDNAVSSSELNDNAVISSKISANAVTTAKISNGAITAAKLDDMDAAIGQILKWNGTTWAPADEEGGTSIDLTAGSGITITGTASNPIITNSGDTDPANDITTSSIASGDINGPFSNLQIKAGAVSTAELANNAVETTKIANGAITAGKISDMGASSGEVLKWTGTAWAPAADLGSSVNVLSGTGIDVTTSGSNFIVTNTGDTDASDDVTNSSQASGDVNGFFNALIIKTGAVTSNKLAAGAVTNFTIANSAITANKLSDMGATNGQVLRWNGTAWAPATITAGSGGDDWGAQTALTGPALTGDGTSSNPLNLAKQGASVGQVLKWSGVAWVPGTVTGIGIGDDWGSQIAVTGAALMGDGTPSNPLNLAKQGATNGQVLKWNGTAWVPGEVIASGDDWGGQAVKSGPALTGNGTSASPLDLANQGATNGQVLQWNGTGWVPGDVAGSGDDWGAQTVKSGTALTGDGTTASPLDLANQGATNGQVLQWNGTGWVPGDVAGSGDDWGTQAAVVGVTLTGDGTTASPLNLARQGANTGQVLKWNGSNWIPSDDQVGTGGGNNNTYAAGSGISITGNAPTLTINNTGDADADPVNELQKLTLTGNQLTLSVGGGTVTLPTGGGTGNTYTGGTGISITGTAPNLVINNTGDVSTTNEIQTISLAGNNLSLSNGGGAVTLPIANTYTAGTAISITGTAPNLVINNTGDASSINELQTLNLAGNNLTLSNGGGTVVLPTGNGNTYTAGVGIVISGSAPDFLIKNAGDLSETNEIQTLTLNGSELGISSVSETVDLAPLLSQAIDNRWSLFEDDLYARNDGSVILGSQTSGVGKLQVTATEAGPAAFFTSAVGPALVTNEGFVGINVPNPLFRLDVAGAGHFSSNVVAPQLTAEQMGADYARLALKNSTGSWTLSGKGGAAATAEFGIDFGGAAVGQRAFTLKGNGNMGVGGLNAGTARLKVFQDAASGGLMLENTTNSENWEFLVNANGELELFKNQNSVGTFANDGVYTGSDRNLKKEIVEMSAGVLNKVLQLQPVTYRYKTQDETARRSMGFIAQDVQSLFPELVTRNAVRDGKGGLLAINYAGFGVLAVKSIQEQQGQIQALKAENEALNSKMETLEARLQRLEQLLGESKKN